MTAVNDAVARYRTMTTEKLLEYEGEDLVLHRPSGLIDDGAGGKQRVGGPDVDLPAQRFFVGGLVTMGRGVATQPERWIITSLGERYREFAVLIGLPDADVEEADWFSRQNDRWEVLFIHDDRTFQTKVEVGRV